MLLERINELAKEHKWSRRELERRSGLSVGSISKWAKFTPNSANLKRVADALNVSVAYLTGESDFRSEKEAILNRWSDEMRKELPDEVKKIELGSRIPVLGEVPCGIPTDAIEIETDEWEEIPDSLAKTGKFFALRTKGDSMSPRIQEGDVLIVRFQQDCESGDVVIVKTENDETTCKKLIKTDDGIILQSFNPAYSPMFFTKQDHITIIGRVIENRQKY